MTSEVSYIVQSRFLVLSVATEPDVNQYCHYRGVIATNIPAYIATATFTGLVCTINGEVI